MNCQHEITTLITARIESATAGGWLNGRATEYTAFCPICKEKLIIPVDAPYSNAQTNQDSEIIFNLLFKNAEDE